MLALTTLKKFGASYFVYSCFDYVMVLTCPLLESTVATVAAILSCSSTGKLFLTVSLCTRYFNNLRRLEQTTPARLFFLPLLRLPVELDCKLNELWQSLMIMGIAMAYSAVFTRLFAKVSRSDR